MINAYLIHDVILIKISYGEWEEEIESEIPIKGRYDSTERLITNSAGALITSLGKVIMEERDISVKDKIKINGVVYPILRIVKSEDFGANKILEVYLG